MYNVHQAQSFLWPRIAAYSTGENVTENVTIRILLKHAVHAQLLTVVPVLRVHILS